MRHLPTAQNMTGDPHQTTAPAGQPSRWHLPVLLLSLLLCLLLAVLPAAHPALLPALLLCALLLSASLAIRQHRWHAHASVRQHQHTLSRLAQALPDALLIVQDGRIVYHNQAARPLLAEASQTRPSTELATLLDTLPESAAGQHGPLRCTLPTSDGSALAALVTTAAFSHEGLSAQLVLIHDISQVEQARQQLQDSNRELQAMAQRLFTVQEEERRAISRDLHDDIGQSITAMKLAAHAAIDEPDPAQRREDLGLLLEMADQTVGRLRDLSTLLRPPQLDALGLEAALSWQVRTILRNSQVQFQVSTAPLSQRPAAVCEQACFRIAQESLTNIVRHAHAGSVNLRLQQTADAWMELSIDDDGDGFELDAPRGLGLAVMRERAQGVGGRLHIDSAPGAGTRIRCHLPFQPVVTGPYGPVNA